MINPTGNINIFQFIINLFKHEESAIDKSINDIADQVFRYTVIDQEGIIEKGRVSHINDPVVSMEEIRTYVRENCSPEIYLNTEGEVITLQTLMTSYTFTDLREQLNRDLPRLNSIININGTPYTFFYFNKSDDLKKVHSYEDIFLLVPVIKNDQTVEKPVNLLDLIDPERIQKDLETKIASLLIQTVAEYEIKKVLFSGMNRSSKVIEEHFNLSLNENDIIMDRTMTIQECDLEDPLNQEKMTFYAFNLEANFSNEYSAVLERKIEIPTDIVNFH